MRRGLVRGLALALGAAAGSTAVAAQETITSKAAKRHVGQYVGVVGEVAKVRVTAEGNMRLELGRPYPTSHLVVIIPRNEVTDFGELYQLKGRWVKVFGMVRRSLLEGAPPRTAGFFPQQVSGPPRIKAPSLVLRDAQKLKVFEMHPTG